MHHVLTKLISFLVNLVVSNHTPSMEQERVRKSVSNKDAQDVSVLI